jgi:hypothetical protein
MPVSEKQLSANQANAQHSTGPKSPEGKRKSSQNARRHSVTAQTTVMTEEDRLKHDAFCADMMAELAPSGSIETFHASSIAEDAWRLQHVRAQCNNIVSIGHFDGTGDLYDADHEEIHTAITAATTVRDNAKTLELLSLYEQRIQRSFQKHFDELKKLQAERKALRAAQLEEARHFSQLAKLQDLPYEPAKDGFIFSNDEIDAYTERYHRRFLAKSEDVTWRTTRGPVRVPEKPKMPLAA